MGIILMSNHGTKGQGPDERESPRTPDQESWVPYATNYPTHLLQQVIKRVLCPNVPRAYLQRGQREISWLSQIHQCVWVIGMANVAAKTYNTQIQARNRKRAKKRMGQLHENVGRERTEMQKRKEMGSEMAVRNDYKHGTLLGVHPWAPQRYEKWGRSGKLSREMAMQHIRHLTRII